MGNQLSSVELTLEGLLPGYQILDADIFGQDQCAIQKIKR